MLFAEAPIIQIATGDLISAAGTLGATLATGVVGAAKIVTVYLGSKDAADRKERQTDRAARQKSDRLVRRAFRKLAAAIGTIREVVDEIKDQTAEHRPLPKKD